MQCFIYTWIIFSDVHIGVVLDGYRDDKFEEEDTSPAPPPSPKGPQKVTAESRRKKCACGKCSRCVPSPSGE